jgi:hypothetical protein
MLLFANSGPLFEREPNPLNRKGGVYHICQWIGNRDNIELSCHSWKGLTLIAYHVSLGIGKWKHGI